MEPQRRYLDGASPESERCALCRSELKPGAGRCPECGSFQGEPCTVCGQRLPVAEAGGAPPAKCTECSSFQSPWRKALAFGDTSLALLTALIAVSTMALPVLGRMLVPVSAAYLGVNPTGEYLRVVVTNRTDGPAYVGGAALVGAERGSKPQKLALVDENGRELSTRDAALLPGTHPIHLRPPELEATACAGPESVFHLEMDLQPGPLWQRRGRHREEIDGAHDFINAFARQMGCTP